MSKIKAIETVYNGYRFRSRLEARWAVFFDALGMKYEYEPQGFQVEIGDDVSTETLRWLPDFFLPASKTWIEVKGSEDAMLAQGEFLEDFFASSNAAEMDGLAGSYTNHYSDMPSVEWIVGARGLVLLGEVPFSHTPGVHLHRLVQLDGDGPRFGWCHFVPSGPKSLMRHEHFLYMFYAPFPQEPAWTARTRLLPYSRHWTPVDEAYAAARQARFEHGETPRVSPP